MTTAGRATDKAESDCHSADEGVGGQSWKKTIALNI